MQLWPRCGNNKLPSKEGTERTLCFEERTKK